ncbi:hypothetical protein KIW84_024129 [Lathyrus oleraceus]|uniref:Uncharacterized protein n=1 Tax=Pisum sativum TaxID=3888 RepID=A0A9D5B7C8_PEA|nr:hypothetical protein KIW84_024129 [Pisum sativum]
MDLLNADVLELKGMMRELFSVVQGLASGQKAMSERLERIEKRLIMEKVQENAPSSEVNKPSGTATKKPSDSGPFQKEDKPVGVPAKKERSKDRYHPYAATVTIPVSNPPAQQQQLPPQQKTPGAKSQVKKKNEDRQFEEPPVTYAFLFQRLRDLGLVRPRILIPIEQQRRPANYDESAKCEFHSGAPGHSIEGCRAFKHIVQDLVDSKAISLAQIMNKDVNPALRQRPAKVKMVKKAEKGVEMIEEGQLKGPKAMFPKLLLQDGALPAVDNAYAAVTTEECVLMKDTTQKMKKVEMDGVRCKAPSLAVETVQVEKALVAEKEKKLSISSYKQALEVVKNQEAQGWGRIIDIVAKADMFGVGYHPDLESSRPDRGCHPLYAFVSAGMMDPGHARSVGGDVDNDRELEAWIKSCVPGNWKASKSITVTRSEE